MRKLSIKQKRLLTKWFKESKKENKILLSFEHLNITQIEILKKINFNELLHININRFLMDLNFENSF